MEAHIRLQHLTTTSNTFMATIRKINFAQRFLFNINIIILIIFLIITLKKPIIIKHQILLHNHRIRMVNQLSMQITQPTFFQFLANKRRIC